MGYMSIQKHTDSQLCLLREPTFFSKAVFIGFFIGVLGIILVGSESFFFKVVIAICAAGLSFLIVDNYEICELDKTTSQLKLSRLHWCQYLLGCLIGPKTQPYVTAKLEDIRDVRVEEQAGGSYGKAYQVILSLDAGIQLGITEVFTTDDISEHEAVVNLIRSFISDLPISKSDEVENEDDDQSTSEDDFEQISQADLESLQEDITANESLLPHLTETNEDSNDFLQQEVNKELDCGETPS